VVGQARLGGHDGDRPTDQAVPPAVRFGLRRPRWSRPSTPAPPSVRWPRQPSSIPSRCDC